MKKVFISLTVLLAVNQLITAQNVDSFITEFAQTDGVETQKIDSQMLTQVKAAMLDSTDVDLEDAEDAEDLNQLKYMEVISCGTPTDELTAKFVNFIVNFTQDADYNLLVKVADGDEKALILSSKSQSGDKMVIIFGVGSDGLNIVRIIGDMDLNDIMNGNNFNF
ncbi:MAG: DUF4252 domain-containing protein [Paludibacter sp.]|nr:DUF4252 domain-containing protein [Paludibacter sp.]